MQIYNNVTGRVEEIQTPPLTPEQAEAEAIRKATPLKYDQPIQARLEIPVAPDHVVRLEADIESGMVIPVEIESTRLTEAEYQATKAAKLTAHRAAHVKAKAEINGQLQKRIENLERLAGLRQ